MWKHWTSALLLESCLNTLHKFYLNIFLFAFVDCLYSYGTLVKLNQYRYIILYYWRQFSLISIIRGKLHILARATCAISLCRQVFPADCFQSSWKAPVQEAAAVEQPHFTRNPFHTWHLQTGFLRSRPHERISSDCFRKFVVYLFANSITACF